MPEFTQVISIEAGLHFLLAADGLWATAWSMPGNALW